MQRILGIFNRDFLVAGFLSLISGKISIEIVDRSMKAEISKVLEDIGRRNNGFLPIRCEVILANGNSIGIEQISIDHPDYLFALSQSLSASGLVTSLVYEDLKDLFIELGKKELSDEEKNRYWVELINLDEESAKQIARFARELRPLKAELEKIDHEWNSLVGSRNTESDSI